MNEDLSIKESIFRIGKVISVEGREIKIKVDKAKNSSSLLYKGELIKNVSVGSYIKIIKGFISIIGKVEGELINEDLVYSKKEYKSDKQKVNRVLKVSLLGFFKEMRFERGIKEMPLIDNECYLLEKSEFEAVHDFIGKNDVPIDLGRLSLEKGQKVRVGINSLFASHIGIFGNTGSGKSYTLARIYRTLFEKFKENQKFSKKARFLLIDFNGEYIIENDEKEDNVIISQNYKKIIKLSSEGGDKYPIDKNSIENIEILSILLDATEKTQTPFLKRSLKYKSKILLDFSNIDTIIEQEIIQELFKKSDRDFGTKILIDFFFDLFNSIENKDVIRDIRSLIETELGSNNITGSYYSITVDRDNTKDVSFGNSRYPQYEQENIETYFLAPLRDLLKSIEYTDSNINLIRLKIILKYYREIITGHSNKEHLSPMISRMHKRFDELDKLLEIRNEKTVFDKFLTVISLKNINDNAIKKVLPLIICKELYEKQKLIKEKGHYLNIIIDEAHNVLSKESIRENEQWKDYRLETFEEIIKEGRKFGVFLTIASQRPSDISPTIVSQLHNYFLHRLINNNDIKAIERTVSYLDKVSFEYLPILPTGTCIMAGLSAQVPVVIDIARITNKDNEPKNKTIDLIKNWTEDEGLEMEVEFEIWEVEAIKWIEFLMDRAEVDDENNALIIEGDFEEGIIGFTAKDKYEMFRYLESEAEKEAINYMPLDKEIREYEISRLDTQSLIQSSIDKNIYKLLILGWAR
ncbi:ATP-binding protein [Allomuricauda sp. NBRC 101325]|uniref:ATP-binding protein n=1 Tax=Allomuricauda sp. NBRC 101325 TaxID=1113758 RepID=UPI0024A26604|nr:ATP-binding protein [Muricauda sp. NBRC 101325]GLU44753.1 hypothetical protein Musp01_23770 [Muricauda sp. NBRC 101325]